MPQNRANKNKDVSSDRTDPQGLAYFARRLAVAKENSRPSVSYGSAQKGITETDLQRLVVDALRWHKYRVLVTSRNRHRCPTCKTFSRAGDGCDKGVPDLLVSLGKGDWRGIELKGPTTRLSPEQKELQSEGRIVVCRSVEEALAAMEEIERSPIASNSIPKK